MELSNTMAFTVDRLASRWDCSPDIIYDLLRKHQLKGFKLGAAWRISVKEVERFESGEH